MARLKSKSCHPSGSGKSFGIKEIARARGVPTREFNFSEASAEALPGYFQHLRDIVRRGETPLCFFDEFDSHGCTLVSRFLAPMQDGEFRDGDQVHPTGRAILAFAGGTAEKVEDFRNGKSSSEDGPTEKAKELKLPDFVSRLNGVIEIKGPNKQVRGQNGRTTEDSAYKLRRAVLLRSMLERFLPQIVTDGDGTAEITEDLIKAFICNAEFKSGARSMEQILKMSAIGSDQSSFGIADLPNETRLQLHLHDPVTFLSAASC